MGKKAKKGLTKLKIWQLIVILIAVVFGTMLFIFLVGMQEGKMVLSLDTEYYCKDECDGEYMEISGVEYEGLTSAGKSFVVFVDQGGCTTADRMRDYVKKYAQEKGIEVYKIMFAEMKETSLHDKVKYYPSVAMIKKGKVLTWLRADSDDDAIYYNDYDEFKKWMDNYLIE